MKNIGIPNFDEKTGIHYGVISQHYIMPEALSDIEPVYPEECECGEECYCEPIGLEYSGEGYEIIDCLDSDLMVTKSPYFTYARQCSPCCPNAGNLDNTKNGYLKTYCLGLDWFDKYSPCPYSVYEVETGKMITERQV